MPSFKTLAQGASALAFAYGALTAPALADDSHLYAGVKNMDVSLSGGTPLVTVRNVAANKLLQNLTLDVQENTIAVGVGGYVECLGTTSENWKFRHGYHLSFGAFGIGRTSLLMSKDLPSSSSIDHVQDMDAHTFQMPANLLGNPQIGVDPVAAILAAAEQAPDKLAWLRQDHVLTVKIPLRWEAGCGSYTRNKITKRNIIEYPDTSYLTKDVDLKIAYKGDPQLYIPKVNAQLGQGLPDQIGGGYPPLKITSMQFQPNMPNHVGACPKSVPMRVNYTGQGKGDLRIRIAFGNTPEHESQVIAFDAKNGPQHYDFELETPYIQNNNLNNTIQYNLRVFISGKGAGEQSWTSYQLMDSAVWKVRCTPQVNPVLGGGGVGGKAPAYQGGQQGGGKAKPVLRLQQPETQPPARPARQSTQ